MTSVYVIFRLTLITLYSQIAELDCSYLVLGLTLIFQLYFHGLRCYSLPLSPTKKAPSIASSAVPNPYNQLEGICKLALKCGFSFLCVNFNDIIYCMKHNFQGCAYIGPSINI